MDTAELAETLAKAAKPVRVVRPPLVRTGRWLLIAPAITILLAAEHGFRSDFSDQLRNPPFVVSIVTSFLTGALAALGCLTASLPDRSRRWLLLPLPLASHVDGDARPWLLDGLGQLRRGQPAPWQRVSMPRHGAPG